MTSHSSHHTNLLYPYTTHMSDYVVDVKNSKGETLKTVTVQANGWERALMVGMARVAGAWGGKVLSENGRPLKDTFYI